MSAFNLLRTKMFWFIGVFFIISLVTSLQACPDPINLHIQNCEGPIILHSANCDQLSRNPAIYQQNQCETECRCVSKCGPYVGSGIYPANVGSYPANVGSYPTNVGSYPANVVTYVCCQGTASYPDTNTGSYCCCPGNNVGAYPTSNVGSCGYCQVRDAKPLGSPISDRGYSVWE